MTGNQFSTPQSSAGSRSGVTALHPETAIRTVRALAAMTAEFDIWLAEEIAGLTNARDRLLTPDTTPAALAEFSGTVARTAREAGILGFPLIAEIASSLGMILDSSRASDLPLDVVDAHLETMAAVASDRSSNHRELQKVVDSLTAAAAEFAAADRPASGRTS